ncbi:MAG: tyrosine-type recombinase/integrase, partial [Thermodesulfobacteriota bacterium]
LKDPTGVGQKVVMQRELIELLKNLPKKSEWVFCRADDEPFSRDHIYKQFKKILKAVGIDPKRYSWKEIRHTTGSLMHRKGVPALAIKDQLRHSDIRTTVDFYIGSDLEYQREQNEKLSNEHFREFLTGSKENSEKTVKKVVNIDALQEVPPIASA